MSGVPLEKRPGSSLGVRGYRALLAAGRPPATAFSIAFKACFACLLTTGVVAVWAEWVGEAGKINPGEKKRRLAADVVGRFFSVGWDGVSTDWV